MLLGWDSQALAFDFQSSRRTMVECHIGKSHHRETLLKEENLVVLISSVFQIASHQLAAETNETRKSELQNEINEWQRSRPRQKRDAGTFER